VEEASKILLLNEFELLYWFNILVNYFTQYSQDDKAVEAITAKTVRLIFFQTGYFIKRFLMQM
jgi:ABC-type oligopeptide transport system substrate-binding subunit